MERRLRHDNTITVYSVTVNIGLKKKTGVELPVSTDHETARCPPYLSGRAIVTPASMVCLGILRREGIVAVGWVPTLLML